MQKNAIITFAIALLIPIIIVGSGLLLYRSISLAIANHAKQDQIRSADTIIIFGAAIGYKGRPSAVLMARIKQGLKLFRSGKAKSFILTGGIGWGPPAESVVMKKTLSVYGVPEESMFFETKSKTTQEQVQFAIRHMKKRGWKKALLVSDPLHMYRLKQYFKGSGLTVYSAPTRTIKRSIKKRRAYIQIELIKFLAHLLFGKQE